MNDYLLTKEQNLVIADNVNYQINETKINILVKSGVTTNLLTYNMIDNIDIKIEIEKDATVNLYQVIQTSNCFDLNEVVNLKNEGATINQIIVLLGTESSKINSNIKIYHNVGNTNSDLKTYSIVKDTANINLANNAYIKQGSASSIARQSSKGLSLSKQGQILIDPNLFIDEYDVMASHGVAMGSLNKEDLFYLMSRGLTKEEASQIVIMGFIEPLLVSIDNEKINTDIREQFQKNLK